MAHPLAPHIPEEGEEGCMFEANLEMLAKSYLSIENGKEKGGAIRC